MALTQKSLRANIFLKISSIRSREAGLLMAIIIFIILFQIKSSRFLSLENIADLLKNTSILATMAVGMMLVMIARGIDLSVGSILALSGMSSAMFAAQFPQLPLLVYIVVGVLVGGLCGLFNGFCIAYFGLQPVIVTLATMNLFRGLTYLLSGGGWVDAYELPRAFKNLGTSAFFSINALVWIALCVFIIFSYFLIFVRTGRKIYAVGASPESAKISGINVPTTLTLTYTIMGLLSGMAGVLWVAKFASAQSDSATGYELQVIAACALGGVAITGGVGRITGVFLGALLLGILNNALPLVNVSPFWQYAIYGAVTLVAVLTNTLMTRLLNLKAQQRRESHARETVPA